MVAHDGQSVVSEPEFRSQMRALALPLDEASPFRAVYDDYSEALAGIASARRQVSDYLNSVFPEQYGFRDQGLMLEMRSLSGAFSREARAARTEAKNEYFESLKSLVPERAGDIEVLRLSHRRAWRLSPSAPWLEFARLGGVAVDVVDVLRATGTAFDDPAVKVAIKEYEVRIDDLLDQVDRSMEALGGYAAVREAIHGDHDPSAELRAIADTRVAPDLASNRIRQLNAQTIDRVIALLPAEQADRVRDLAVERAYPGVTDLPGPLSVIDATESFDDLTADQRDALAQIRERFLRARASTARKLGEALDALFDEQVLRQYYMRSVENTIRMQSDKNVKPEGYQRFQTIAAEWKERVKRFEEEALAVLTDEQRRRIR